MDRTQAKDLIKQQEPDFLTPAKTKVNGHTSYICPKCGNGSGKSGTGIALDPHNTAQGKRYTCFRCSLSEDIIGLWKIFQNITDDKTAFEGLYNHYHIDLDSPAPKTQPKQEQRANNEKSDNMAYYAACAGSVKDTDYFTKRGLSEDTIAKYQLGYDDKYWDTITKRYWYAVIIPINKNYFIVRNTDPRAIGDNRYRKHGSSFPYLAKTLQEAKRPIFVVEGELDALSIIEAGGEAVGLGSTTNGKKFVELVKKGGVNQPIIIALDNDEAGKKAANELKAELEALDQSITTLIFNPFGEHKDANEALTADRESLINNLEQAEKTAYQLQNQALEEERKEYLKTSTAAHIQEFINGIAASVNTPFIPTGFNALDKILEGGLYEGLYIMGAVSSLGKTTLALQICDQIAASGTDVLIFSLEMARSELMAKSISRLTIIDVIQNKGNMNHAKTTRGITTGSRWEKYCSEEKALIQRSINAYSQYAGNIYIHEGIGDIGADKVRQEVEKHIRVTGKKPVVLIDYVQILAPYDVRASDKQNTDKAVLELKRISRDFKIPVIGISSFNRDNYKNAVTMEAFKESGSLEYGSDVLIGLQFNGAGTKEFNLNDAKKKNPREIELVVLKNRNGRTGYKVRFEYYPMFNYFDELNIDLDE